MILVKQTSSRAHQLLPNHAPKLSPMELAGDRGPSLLETQPQAFQRLHVNHCTPYTYTIRSAVLPVNHCTPYTYIKNPARLYVNRSTPYTYTTDCARCVINPSLCPPLLTLHPTCRNALKPSPASPRLKSQGAQALTLEGSRLLQSKSLPPATSLPPVWGAM